MARNLGTNPPVRGKVMRGRRARPEPSRPFTCTQSAFRDNERIFALEGGNFGTGMTESELGGVVAAFEGAADIDAEMRRSLATIRAALDLPPRPELEG